MAGNEIAFGATTLERFVAFESIDGAGTSTQLALLHKRLSSAGIPHWITAEPTALPTGRLIREALRGDFPAEPGTIARLFAADRHEHLHGSGQVLERLARGEWVLTDRYLFSSLAYQGRACGDDTPWELNRGFPLPALVLYFEIDPEVSLARIHSRPGRDIYETLEFQRSLAAAYEDAFARWGAGSFRLERVDASGTPDQVAIEVARALSKAGLVFPASA
ncbi:MAG: dTMP kinase [Spirochaetales bacterium]|nr:dTMP kinase [Spirochaetales bacterium]